MVVIMIIDNRFLRMMVNTPHPFLLLPPLSLSELVLLLAIVLVIIHVA